MSRMGFWQLLLDDKVSTWEARRIDAATEGAEIAQAHAVDAQFALRGMAGRFEALGREVIMLRTAVTVLTRTLANAKLLDVAALDQALADALEAAYPTPPDPAQAAARAAEELSSRRYTCIRCRQDVLASTTSMTADGPVCDRCPPVDAPYR